MLEIRGLSRGSLIETSRQGFLNPTPDLRISPEGPYNKTPQDTPDPPSDDDDSTITGGSVEGFPVHKEDAMTVSDSSHYWSATNSFTTGNTTERSSLYSWGDDEFDHQASRVVKEMFHAIEKMLFESVLSGSSLLQHECREWMEAFPHLRILGRQAHSVKDEGFQSFPSSRNFSETATASTDFQISDTFECSDFGSLTLSGSAFRPTPVPLRYLIGPDSHGESGGSASEFSHLQEEIFEQDGDVEEYLAYDIREMDEDDMAKRYHVPRRRRLGYPPITPNACVRDAVINQLFDITWRKMVSSLHGRRSSGNLSQSKSKKSLWKVLFDNFQAAKKQHGDSPRDARHLYLAQSITKGPFMDASFPRYDEDDKGALGEEFGVPMPNDRYLSAATFGNPHSDYFSHFGHRSLAHSRLHDTNVLPPSRGSHMDQSLSGPRQFPLSGRLSSFAPNSSDFASLDGVMKISRKRLQQRSERSGVGQALGNGESIESFDAQHLYGGMLTATGLSGRAPASPQGAGGRPYLSLSGVTARQPSAKYKSRSGRPAKLLPLALDKPKTPVEFDGFVKATKLRISSGGPSNFNGPSEIVGIRVTSPTGPPPTAPAMSGGNLWMNSRLPPLSLEGINENSPAEFKRPRGRTAHSRISSAVAEDSVLKQTRKGWEGVSRPNTTHAFRTDIPNIKRSSSITPSNISGGNFGSPPAFGKSSSPTALQAGQGTNANFFYSQHLVHSPDNHIAGLAGITGIGMLGGTGISHSPADRDEDARPVHSGWGLPVRRKRTVLGS